MLWTRTPIDDDWRQIDWLASNEVQEADHSQHEGHWARRRREFDGEKYESVLVLDDQVVAFCSLEKDPAHSGFRAFLVLNWSSGDGEIRRAAVSKLETLIKESGTSTVWMRELAEDRALLQFMTRCGFQVEKEYELDGTRYVNLVRAEV